MVSLSLMPKQENVHLHGLFAELREFGEHLGNEYDLAEYESLDIEHTSIHRSRLAHKKALAELVHGMASSIDPKGDYDPFIMDDEELSERMDRAYHILESNTKEIKWLSENGEPTKFAVVELTEEILEDIDNDPEYTLRNMPEVRLPNVINDSYEKGTEVYLKL